MTREQSLKKHARLIEALKVLVASKKFTRTELMNWVDLMTGYCTQGEKWDVAAEVHMEMEKTPVEAPDERTGADKLLHDYYFLAESKEQQKERGEEILAWLEDAWEHDDDMEGAFKRIKEQAIQERGF